jgi:hypothetical protein
MLRHMADMLRQNMRSQQLRTTMQSKGVDAQVASGLYCRLLSALLRWGLVLGAAALAAHQPHQLHGPCAAGDPPAGPAPNPPCPAHRCCCRACPTASTGWAT